jgi:hypothetical protein
MRAVDAATQGETDPRCRDPATRIACPDVLSAGAVVTSEASVHAVMHLAWVDKGEGVYQGQIGAGVAPSARVDENGWNQSVMVGSRRL